MTLNTDFINSLNKDLPEVAKTIKEFYESKEDITSEEIQKLINSLKLIKIHRENKGHKNYVGFVPTGLKVPTGMRVPGQGDFVMQDAAMNAAAGAARSIFSDIQAGRKPMSRQSALSAVVAGAQSAFPDIDFSGFTEAPNTPGGGGGTSIGNSPMANSPYNGQGFIFQPKPLEVRYRPDLPNTIYGEVVPEAKADFNDGNDNGTQSTLNSRIVAHLTQANISIPSQNTAAGTTINNYFDDVWIPTVQLKAQGSVSFNINASANFSSATMRDYLTRIIDALSIYYFFAHTYGYCTISSNRNPGIFNLREMFATSDVQNLALLQERLQALPIPPRINELLYWFYNIYREDSIAGSNLIMNIPTILTNGQADPNDPAKGLANQALVSQQLASLADPGFINTTNFLMRVCPNWSNTQVGSAMGIVEHDPNFTTTWKNEPFSGITKLEDTGVSLVYTIPQMGSANLDVPYSSFVESLSGGIQSLHSIYSTTNNAYQGFVGPLVSTTGLQFGTNRWSYLNSSGVPGAGVDGWFDATWFQRAQTSRNETYTFSQNKIVSRNFMAQTVSGSTPVEGINLNSNAQITAEFIRWLTQLDEIGSRAKMAPDAMKGGNKGRSRKRK